jgi:hypothetical protein
LPFYGAFLFHEMRVRGYWPHRADRAIPLPITWVDWLDDDDGDDGNGRGRGGRGGRGGHGGRGGRGGSNKESGSERLLRSPGAPGSSASGKMFIPKNPFANPSTLKGLKESFEKQPNWKAAVIEGTTWEGNADENATKWRKLNHIDT